MAKKQSTDRHRGLDCERYRVGAKGTGPHLPDGRAVARSDGSTADGGKHDKCRFFVLDLHHDKFSTAALLGYAMACRAEFPQLAADLDKLIDEARGVSASKESSSCLPSSR